MTNKYNIGDKVWVMRENKAEQLTITAISTYDDKIIYGFNSAGKYDYRLFGHEITTSFESYEHDVFPTKEDLLKSL